MNAVPVLHYSVEWEHFLSHRTIKSAELEGFLFFQLDKSKTLSKRKWLNTKFLLNDLEMQKCNTNQSAAIN